MLKSGVVMMASVVITAGSVSGAIATNELHIAEATGKTVKPLNGLGGGPKTGWGVGKDGGIYSDSTPFYRKIAPPFVRLHDIETPFGREQFFDVHIYMADTTPGHTNYFGRSDAYIDSILAVAPNAKIIFRIGESIGASDDMNPYAVKPSDYDAWTAAAVDIARHYVTKYPRVEWLFEIWNEANLTGPADDHSNHKTFSSAPSAGDTCPADDYFRLYVKAALALGQLRKTGGYRNMKIGGPAESGVEKGDWSTFSCREFVAYLENYNAEHKCVVPLDFYSWHQYDGPTVVTPVANDVRRYLAATKHYRKALNICDEWNLTVASDRVGQIALAEGAANTLATMISWQESELDAAVYYDAQLTGGFNGLWYKPYLDALMDNQTFMFQLMTAYSQGGIPAVTELQRQFLAPSAEQAPVPLGGYWAMRAFSAVAAHGRVLGIDRGSAVPSTVYALASRDAAGGAIAIVNNSSSSAKIRVGAIPFQTPVTLSRVKGSNTSGAEVKPVLSSVSGNSVDLALDPYEMVLLDTDGGLK